MEIENYDNIIDILQRAVDTQCLHLFGHDTETPPRFIVSVLYTHSDDDNDRQCKDQKIILTVEHHGSKFSAVLFPIPDSIYGYESLESTLRSLYNQTM
jgi:hypothetical protein